MIEELNKDLAVAQTIALITSYSFDLQGHTIAELISQWLIQYHASWIRLATIEALYLGRYKAISIEQILQVWGRLGSPNTHFTHEFERLISRKLPRHLVNPSLDSLEDSVAEETKTSLKLTDFSNFSASKNRETTTEPNLSATESATNTSDRSFSAPSSDCSNDNNLPLTDSDNVTDSSIDSQSTQSPESNSTSTSSLSEPTNTSMEKYHFSLPHQPQWTRPKTYQTPIHEFTPLPDVSPLYQKLKAVAQQLEEDDEEMQEEE